MEAEVGHGPVIPYLREVLVFLLASVLVVPLCQRLRVSPVLGYLIAGVAIGPFAFGIVNDIEGVRRLGELGVMFLLFTIGLELSLERLLAMRRYVFGLGAAQVGASGLVIGAIAYAWGNNLAASVVLGASLALSSTALVMQILIERGEIASRVGRVSFAVLLFQDLAVAPLIALVTILARGEEDALFVDLALAVGKAVLAIAIILVLGRLLLRPLFRMVALGRRPDVFVAMSLLLVLVTASATAMAGLSMALGAFLAGVVLAETEYRHQVETDIEPFRGLLLGVFFVSVGMGINLGEVADLATRIALAVIGLILIKAAIMAGLALLFGLSRAVALHVGLLLGQSGEFAFFIIGLAMAGGLVPTAVGQFMLIVAALSMMLTPLLALLGPWLVHRLGLERESMAGLTPAPKEVEDLHGHVVIAGYGRVGQTIARLLRQQKIAYVALDIDARHIRRFRQRHEPVFYGDASHGHVLEQVRADRAAAVVITLDDTRAAARMVEHVRRHWPAVQIFVRARDAAQAEELRDLGVSGVVPETLEASLALAGQVLQATGASREAINRMMEQIRREEYVRLAGESTEPPPARAGGAP